MVQWHLLIELEHDPKIAWDIWQHMFLDIADYHAPVKKERVRRIPPPWITPDLKRLIFQRDKLKKKAQGSQQMAEHITNTWKIRLIMEFRMP